MEINFFLDNQQIDYDVLTTDVRVNVVDSSDQITISHEAIEAKSDENTVEETAANAADEDPELGMEYQELPTTEAESVERF